MNSGQLAGGVRTPVLVGLSCCLLIYLATPALLWLPLVPAMRKGYRSPMIAVLFTPDRILFDHWQPYTDFVHWQARVLRINDLDYEYVFLGSSH